MANTAYSTGVFNSLNTTGGVSPYGPFSLGTSSSERAGRRRRRMFDVGCAVLPCQRRVPPDSAAVRMFLPGARVPAPVFEGETGVQPSFIALAPL